MSQLLTTYLQDHHAGSSGGVDAFDRVAQGHGDESVREAVGRLADQIREDQASLESIMEQVGARPSKLKDAAVAIGEKVSRLKPNERLVFRSPLSDVVELEALVTAVHAKGLLWQVLLTLADERIDRADLQRLADRADAQHAELKQLHLGQVTKLTQT